MSYTFHCHRFRCLSKLESGASFTDSQFVTNWLHRRLERVFHNRMQSDSVFIGKRTNLNYNCLHVG